MSNKTEFEALRRIKYYSLERKKIVVKSFNALQQGDVLVFDNRRYLYDGKDNLYNGLHDFMVKKGVVLLK